MGCDIHSFIEIRTKDKWELCEIPYFTEYDYKKTRKYEKNFTAHPFDWRSYGMFSVLAGVRGSAKPITPPKGIPEDVSSDISKNWEQWGSDGHTPSYYVLRELLEFNFLQNFTYETFASYGGEDEILISNPNKFGNTFNSRMICLEKVRPKDGYERKGKITYKTFLGELFFLQLDEMCDIKNPEDVRIVFWFDN